MPRPDGKIAIVAALHREVSGLIKDWQSVSRQYEGRDFRFSESDRLVLVCGGIGVEAARRATEAIIALYQPGLIVSTGFAGALVAGLKVGDLTQHHVQKPTGLSCFHHGHIHPGKGLR